MAEVKFEAVFKFETTSQGQNVSASPMPSEQVKTPTPTPTPEKQDSSKGLTIKQIIPKAIVAGATAAVISNVGTFAGEAAQNVVNNSVKIVASGAALAVGLATNWVVTAITTAIKLSTNAINIANKNREWQLKENRNAERIGKISSERGRA